MDTMNKFWNMYNYGKTQEENVQYYTKWLEAFEEECYQEIESEND